MRVLYLDESGIGSLQSDPHLVVAGVIIHADTQWRRIAKHLADLLVAATPDRCKVPSCLHAKDIFHGTGEFPRDRWSQDVRFKLLDEVAKVPFAYRVPIVWGLIDRAESLTEHPQASSQERLINDYSTASLICLLQAEWFMRTVIGDKEVLSVTFEENRELQKRINEIYKAVSSAEILDRINPHPAATKLLPITRVIDAPNSQKKTSSSILQLADYCCFAIKRAARQQSYHERFAEPLSPTCILSAPSGDEPFYLHPFLKAAVK